MKPPDFDKNRLRQLIAEALDGQIDEAGRHALNETLTASAEARRHYAEMMDLHARLHLEYNGGREADFMPGEKPVRSGKQSNGWRTAWMATAAAFALFGAAALMFFSGEHQPPSFATLEKSPSARWGAGDLPTREGTRLGAGTLRLEEGLAVIRFDSGAKVSLEAPVEFRLLDAMNGHILSGTAVADVPESAIGFRIGTPSAMVVDFGTRFAISVDPQSGGTRAQVFEGLIEVKNPITSETVSLKTGQRTSVEGRLTGPVTEGFEERFHPTAVDPFSKSPDWVLRKATQDAYIGHTLVTDSTELLYVKNGESDFNRRAYFAFDLSGLDPGQIVSAGLMLYFEPTGLGLASHVPDATFAVYGLLATDQPWDENNLRPRNAPANIRGTGDQLIADEVTKLGTFVVPQGVQRGRFGIENDTLAAFLRQRPGSTVTLILVRETAETASAGLIHGIASRRHPTLPAPTLAIRLREE